MELISIPSGVTSWTIRVSCSSAHQIASTWFLTMLTSFSFLDEKLHVMTMQDFGGDGVVSSGTGLGAVFVLPDSFQSF
jgi:hypothetical protein